MGLKSKALSPHRIVFSRTKIVIDVPVSDLRPGDVCVRHGEIIMVMRTPSNDDPAGKIHAGVISAGDILIETDPMTWVANLRTGAVWRLPSTETVTPARNAKLEIETEIV